MAGSGRGDAMAAEDEQAGEHRAERPEQPDNPWPSDPVIFGSPPFGPPPQNGGPPGPRPTWTVVVGVLVVVMVLVGALAIWIR